MDEKNHKAPRRHPYYRMIIVCIAHSLKTITFTGVDHTCRPNYLFSELKLIAIKKGYRYECAKLRCTIIHTVANYFFAFERIREQKKKDKE